MLLRAQTAAALRGSIALAFVASVAGCPAPSDPEIDVGPLDAGSVDSGPRDVGPSTDSPVPDTMPAPDGAFDAPIALDAPGGLDAPVVGTDAPVVGTDAPVVGTDAPVVGTDAPVVGTDAPVVGTDAPVVVAVCGDGVRSGTEQCDDGNTTAGDGCGATCNVEPSPTCGDGRVDRASGEECDDGGTANGDGCDARCRVEVPPSCGNGMLEIALGEECDDGNVVIGDGCSGSCQIEAVGAMCGNGTTTPPEVCDDNNLVNGDACNPTCNLTNTTSLFAGMPGVAGRTDGIGSAARFTSSGVLAVDARYLWMAEGASVGPPAVPGVLRRIEIATADVVTVAIVNGTGGVATNGVDTVWVAGGTAIQSISTTAPYTVTTIHGAVAQATSAANFFDGPPGMASFGDVRGLTFYAGSLWIVDTAAAVIRRMNPTTGDVTTVAGSPFMAPAVGLDGVGIGARFTSPRYIVSNNSGILYISDTNGAAIRAMNAGTFAVTTVAGMPGTAGYVDGVGASVRVHRPRGITADGSSVYFCEANAQTIRQIVLASGATGTLVGTADTTGGSTGGYLEGVGTAALLGTPFGIAYHYPTNSIFFSDASRTIRRIR